MMDRYGRLPGSRRAMRRRLKGANQSMLTPWPRRSLEAVGMCRELSDLARVDDQVLTEVPSYRRGHFRKGEVPPLSGSTVESRSCAPPLRLRRPFREEQCISPMDRSPVEIAGLETEQPRDLPARGGENVGFRIGEHSDWPAPQIGIPPFDRAKIAMNQKTEAVMTGPVEILAYHKRQSLAVLAVRYTDRDRRTHRDQCGYFPHDGETHHAALRSSEAVGCSPCR